MLLPAVSVCLIETLLAHKKSLNRLKMEIANQLVLQSLFVSITLKVTFFPSATPSPSQLNFQFNAICTHFIYMETVQVGNNYDSGISNEIV